MQAAAAVSWSKKHACMLLVTAKIRNKSRIGLELRGTLVKLRLFFTTLKGLRWISFQQLLTIISISFAGSLRCSFAHLQKIYLKLN